MVPVPTVVVPIVGWEVFDDLESWLVVVKTKVFVECFKVDTSVGAKCSPEKAQGVVDGLGIIGSSS